MKTMDTPATSVSTTEHEPNKRRRKYVSRACTTCRRRRTRCNGEPRCSTCVTHDEECVYDPNQDGRRSATKTYVEALVNRVHHLEGLLGSSQPLSAGQTGDRNLLPPHSAVGASGLLRIDGGSLTYHGPSSAYMLFPDSSERIDEEDDEVDSDVVSPYQSPFIHIPHTQWDRHLPPYVLPNAVIHEEVLDVFFSYLNDWCCVVEELGFRAGLLASASSPSNIHRNAHYSPILHNAILALAISRCTEILTEAYNSGRTPTLIDATAAAAAFAQRARWLIEEEAARPMISTAKGVMLLGCYHSAVGSLSLGWFYEGMAVRMAQAIGLNADCSSLVKRGVIPQRLKGIRDRSLWTIYIQDQLWTLSIGRTAGITEDDIETSLPSLSAEMDSRTWCDHMERRRMRHNPGILGLGVPSWSSSTFLYTCHLFLLADKMRQTLYRMRSRHDAAMRRCIVSDLHLNFAAWVFSLPPALRIDTSQSLNPVPVPHIIMMHANFRYFQILLHRPRYTQPHAPDDEDWSLASKTCSQAADEIMKLVELYDTKPGVLYASTGLINVIFAAGTIHLLSAVQSSGTDGRTNGITNTRKCIDAMRKMSWRSARDGADTLRQMLDEWIPQQRSTQPSMDIQAPREQQMNPLLPPQMSDVFSDTQDGFFDSMVDLAGFQLDPFSVFNLDTPQTFAGM